MAGAKAKTGRGRAAGELPADAESLLQLIIEEIRAPADTQKVLERLPAVETCVEEARRFLKAKDRAVRREGYIKNERLWFNKYGWFMARVVILFGLLSLVLYTQTREAGVDFLTALVLGAAGYYLLLFTLSNYRFSERNRKRRKLLASEAEKYQRVIVRIAAALLERNGARAERYPIADPHTPAGLEQREDGYFIPIEEEPSGFR